MVVLEESLPVPRSTLARISVTVPVHRTARLLNEYHSTTPRTPATAKTPPMRVNMAGTARPISSKLMSPQMPIGAPGFARSAEEDLGLGVTLHRHRLELVDGLGQRHPDDVGTAQRDHLAERAVVDGVDRLQAEPGGEHAVERGRRAAA